jgi:YbbR domain-containing protein
VGEGNHYGFGQTYSYRWLDQTAVSTLSDSNIKIYRQENTLNIDGLNTEFQVTIFNLQGIKVKEINSTDNRIDISSLLQGTYIVSISNNQFKINKKIIL